MRRLNSPRLAALSLFAGVMLVAAVALGQGKQPIKPKPNENMKQATDSVAASGAKVYVPEDDFNFGYVPNNSEITHVYKLLSVGKEPLKILRVKPG